MMFDMPLIADKTLLMHAGRCRDKKMKFDLCKLSFIAG